MWSLNEWPETTFGSWELLGHGRLSPTLPFTSSLGKEKLCSVCTQSQAEREVLGFQTLSTAFA